MSLKVVLKKLFKAVMTIPMVISGLVTRSHKGISYKLVYGTVDQLVMGYAFDPSLQKKATIGLAQLGGAFATVTTQEQIDEICQQMINAGKKPQADITRYLSKPGYGIVLVKDFLKDFNRKEMKAIYYHELGHLVNGDLSGNPTGLVVDLDKELAADAYAVKYTDAKTMHSVLDKLCKNIFERFAPIVTSEEMAVIKEEFFGVNGIMTKRLAALQAM